jgi:peptidyl-prolyl cis-trans isomerase A (cyclophilin A)
MRQLRFLALFAALAFAFSLSAQQRPPTQKPAPHPRPTPGLYMTFVTSKGPITCRLFPKQAPIAVHTIVGLATGKLPYIDPVTHKRMVGKHFYNGITFHRVIPRFMIQAGDPTGTGKYSAEGPGFPYGNEVSPNLKFDRPGRLALANEGRPKTNGSQFFITEVPVPRLNGGYTIFGQCGDLSVVKAIARVPRDANNKPLKPVVIRRVDVFRIKPEPNHTSKTTSHSRSSSGRRSARGSH